MCVCVCAGHERLHGVRGQRADQHCEVTGIIQGRRLNVSRCEARTNVYLALNHPQTNQASANSAGVLFLSCFLSPVETLQKTLSNEFLISLL